MSISLKSFAEAAAATRLDGRHLLAEPTAENGTVVLGHIGRWSVTRHAKALNAATLQAFRRALEDVHGIFGIHAFDRLLGGRLEAHQPLRAADVRQVLLSVPDEKMSVMKQEITRLSETLPGLRSYSEEQRKEIRREAANVLRGKLDRNPDLLSLCRTEDDLSVRAEVLLNDAVGAAPEQPLVSR